MADKSLRGVFSQRLLATTSDNMGADWVSNHWLVGLWGGWTRAGSAVHGTELESSQSLFFAHLIWGALLLDLVELALERLGSNRTLSGRRSGHWWAWELLVLRVIVKSHALAGEDRLREVLDKVILRVTEVRKLLVVVTSNIWGGLAGRQGEEGLDIATEEELISVAEVGHWHGWEDNVWLDLCWCWGLNDEFSWVTEVRVIEGVLGRAWRKSWAV